MVKPDGVRHRQHPHDHERPASAGSRGPPGAARTAGRSSAGPCPSPATSFPDRVSPAIVATRSVSEPLRGLPAHFSNAAAILMPGDIEESDGDAPVASERYSVRR